MSRSRLAFAVCIASMLVGCPSTPEQRFESWTATPQAAGLTDYQTYLQRQGVDHVLPAPSLLRSGRRWRACKTDEFALPPGPLRPNIVSTLRALGHMQSEGLLKGAQVVSAYRGEAFNRCEGGSRGSQHLLNNALDFDLAETSSGNVERLCSWWWLHGQELKLGLGFYTDHKIHIDTSGFRTWGRDYTRKTSLCTPRPAPARVQAITTR